MGRLIDSEQVKLMLSELLEVAEKENFNAEDAINHAYEWVDNIPTAYNVDAVVAESEKEKGFRMDSAMKKLKKIIDDVTDKGDKSRHKLSLFEVSELILYFEDLWKCKSVMVIDEKLKDILVKCGFEATEDDIGWIVK